MLVSEEVLHEVNVARVKQRKGFQRQKHMCVAGLNKVCVCVCWRGEVVCVCVCWRGEVVCEYARVYVLAR